MGDKRFKICIDSNNGVGLFDNSLRLLFIKFTNKEDAVSCKNGLMYQCNLMNELYDENEQLKYIDNPIDEEMTNIECLILLIPFGILFILLTGIIISFIVQLGWVVI